MPVIILLYILAQETATKIGIMTEFDQKLRLKLVEHKMKSGNAIYEIANACGISRNSLYSFNAGNSALSAENTYKLMNYLNLTVNLETK